MKVLDLFAGAGGMGLGLSLEGHEIVHSVDNWEAACSVLRQNFTHPVSRLDLQDQRNWDEVLDLDFDLIAGGPPCQDFSIAGQRNTDGTRANLTISYAQMVAKARPKHFLMENVNSIVGTDVLSRSMSILESAGYSMSQVIINAALTGVPQARKRFILVGSRGVDAPLNLEQFYEANRATTPMSVADYMGDSIDTEYYYAHPRSYKRRAVFSIFEPSSTIRGVNRPMPANYTFHPADRSMERHLIRPLTSLERAQIQTFPKDFLFLESKSQTEQLIGNAVPVNLAKFLGKFLKEL